jgi:holliday junction DNA helicase RuvA
MIAYLKGKIINKTEKGLILLVDNIGYEIFVPEKILLKIKKEQEVQFYIYHKQKEDAQELYGFKDLVGRDFFMQLISVSGVGPKSALNVMSITSVQDLKEAIVSGDADIFKKVSGIGTKTAERIVVELKNKFGALKKNTFTNEIGEIDSNLEVFEALNALGFSDDLIRPVYNQIPRDLKNVSDKIKFALKLLKK